MNKKIEKRVLCLGCASIIDAASEMDICCPSCGRLINLSDYNRLFQKISSSVVYGYKYRTKYERQYSQYGEIRTHYSISECSDILQWVALASLSGVIGAASWDVVKTVISKIKNQINSKDIKEIEFLSEKASFDQFVLYLKEFYEDFPSAQGEIKKLILKEIVIDSFTEVATPIVMKIFDESKNGNASNISKELLKSEVSNKFNSTREHKIENLSKEELSDIWQFIDLAG
jgi:hypothetical protein